MKYIFGLLILLLIPVVSVATSSVDDLTLITEEYPPFNFSEDGVRYGISTDMLVEMLGASGSLRSHKDIGSLPWARAYRIAQNSENILLYSITRTKKREKLFKWVGPILQSEIVLMGKKDKKIKLASVLELNQKNLRIGVVLDDIGHQLLKGQGIATKHLYPSNKGIYLAQMLTKDRVDLIAYDKMVALWNLKSLGFKPNDYEPVLTLKKADYYYALSLDVSDELVNQLQSELDRFKKNDRLDEIIRSYLH